MQKLVQTESLDLPATRSAPRSQRSSSISNDRASLSVASLPCPPAVNPDPAYIAPSSASQIVTGVLDEEGEDGTFDSGSMNALVTPNALTLVNSFLDQLLYSILAISRSTNLASLKPAINEVLKPRLAREAIASADAELGDFLNKQDYDELSAFQQGFEPRGNWDLNLVWRRTRLRCMVYTRLGDYEEEDEDIWIQRENVGHTFDGRNRLSRDLGVVSPSSAIFLTSIVEFIAEEVLRLSGRAAFARVELRRRLEKPGLAKALDERLSVEVIDIEKLAVNTTFGRLWRSWKKKVRSPSVTSQRPSSRELLLRPASSLSSSEPRSRKASVGENGALMPDPLVVRSRPTTADREKISEAAAMPLPLSRDGASHIDDPDGSTLAVRSDRKERPHSMTIASNPTSSSGQTDAGRAADTLKDRPRWLEHNRSSSLPHLAMRLFPSSDSSSPSITSRPSVYNSNLAAVSTMYDGVIDREEHTRRVGEHPAAEQPGLTAQDLTPQEKEMQDLDDGLDSLAEASNGCRPVDEQPSPYSAQRSPTIPSNNVHLPSRIENRLDSKRMQGHTKGDAFLEKHETSIVESAPSRGYGNNNLGSQDVPGGKALDFNDKEDYDDVPNLFKRGLAYSPDVDSDRATSPSEPTNRSEAYSNTVPHAFPTFAQSKLPAKVSDIRKQLPPVSTGVERAAVQRLSLSPGGTIDSPVGRTSTSSSRELRALHTSGSSASQKAARLKGLVGRESSDTNRQFALSRTSSEGSSVAIRTPKVEAQQSFEKLMKSDETIQYTLTPRSVREMDGQSPDSAQFPHSRTDVADPADFIRTSGPPSAETSRPQRSRSIVSLKAFDGLRSNLASKPTSPPILEKPMSPTQRSRPVPAKSPGAPRGAQLPKETTRDFADFIRSTGPEEETGSIQRDGAASSLASTMKPKISTEPEEQPGTGQRDEAAPSLASTSRPNRAMAPSQRSASGSSAGRKITKQNPSLSKSPPPAANNSPAKRRAPKLQAREATYEPTHNEDLLDFLKQGPADDRHNQKRPTPGPVASVVPQNPRVVTNVRPRESELTRSSFASTQDSSYANQSVQSESSRTGLLDSPRAQNSRSPPLPQAPFADPPNSARKHRHVKDPYAIETDSEGEDDATTGKPNGQPESLIDFLNSTRPSDTNPRIPSAFDDMPSPPGRSIRSNATLKNISNQPTTRAAATPGIRSAAQAPTPKSQKPVRGRPTNQPPPQLPPFNSGDISPHLSTTQSTTTGTNGTVPTANYPLYTQEVRTRPIKAAGVARAEREPQRGMGDLADFLRNSEPPTQLPEEFQGKPKMGEAVEGKDAPHGLWGKLKGRRKGVK
ncbi:MAG: hypothetical protein Q9184_007376 [Pyrenodesmia sp. 2 TL-2023]